MILAPFRVRSFRFQWPADLLTSWAFEMETLVLGWYVMVQTGSVLILTLFGSLQFLGTLAAPIFGVLGDRVGSRAMLCAMRGTCAFFALVLMVLALTGALTPAIVLVVGAVVGLVRPNDIVMRNSLIGDTIPRGQLMGALSLSRATMDSARVAGALAGAGLSERLGIGGAYVAVVAFHAASVALTFGVGRRGPVDDLAGDQRAAPAAAPLGPVRASGWRDLIDGLLYVWTSPRLMAAMCLAFLVNLTAYPISGGLLPYVAREVYRVDATGLGLLAGSFALGALTGSVGMVVTGGTRHAERSMVIAIAGWYALLLLFAFADGVAVAAPVLLAAGLVQSIGMISMSASLLRAAGDRFRARVMGVRTLAVYGLPVGLLAAGGLIDTVGFSATVAAYCGIGLLFTALIAAVWRADLWRR